MNTDVGGCGAIVSEVCFLLAVQEMGMHLSHKVSVQCFFSTGRQMQTLNFPLCHLYAAHQHGPD